MPKNKTIVPVSCTTADVPTVEQGAAGSGGSATPRDPRGAPAAHISPPGGAMLWEWEEAVP